MNAVSPKELIKENMRVLEWGLFSPDGLLFGAFRYKEDAIHARRTGMTVAPLEIQPVMHTCDDVSVQGDFNAVYITLIALADVEVSEQVKSGLKRGDLSQPYRHDGKSLGWMVNEQLYPESRGHKTHSFLSFTEARDFIEGTPE